MKLENKKLIVKRSYKEVYKCDEGIVKIFEKDHPKADVFNEALNTARVEATGLDIPKIKEVSEVDGKWALLIEYKNGTTLEEMMESDKENLQKYMEDFVDLQLEMHSKKAPLLNKLKDKLARQINGLKELDATTRYELMTRLEGMPKHDKLCHGDFNPSNIIVSDDGPYVIDWSHATQGNAAADAALTYLLLRMRGRREEAEQYLALFCEKSGIEPHYIRRWMPLVAASQTVVANARSRAVLQRWIDDPAGAQEMETEVNEA